VKTPNSTTMCSSGGGSGGSGGGSAGVDEVEEAVDGVMRLD
jgi:hypothetical protein